MVSDTMLKQLRKGLFVSVVSSQRIQKTISGVCSSHSYVMTPATALAYAGLMDYRAKSGETNPGIIWSEKSPVHETLRISQALGMSQQELQHKLDER